MLSVNTGSIPKYSAVASVENPAVRIPSISLIRSPASSSALCAASAWCCNDDLPGTLPITSDSATPTMAMSRGAEEVTTNPQKQKMMGQILQHRRPCHKPRIPASSVPIQVAQLTGDEGLASRLRGNDGLSGGKPPKLERCLQSELYMPCLAFPVAFLRHSRGGGNPLGSQPGTSAALRARIEF